MIQFRFVKDYLALLCRHGMARIEAGCSCSNTDESCGWLNQDGGSNRSGKRSSGFIHILKVEPTERS